MAKSKPLRDDGDLYYLRSTLRNGEGHYFSVHTRSQKNAIGEDLEIAHLHVPLDGVRHDRFSAGDVYVSEAFRRHGIATNLYAVAEARFGVPATRGSQQSQEGAAFWEARLATAGASDPSPAPKARRPTR